MPEAHAPTVSHGRGGAGNIGEDAHLYTDGEIVREGAVGDQGDGPYSSGRGGKGNIGATHSPRLPSKDQEVVPETATKLEQETSHHYGRGGAGNLTHKNTKDHDHPHESLAEKLKHFVGKKGSKEHLPEHNKEHHK